MRRSNAGAAGAALLMLVGMGAWTPMHAQGVPVPIQDLPLGKDVGLPTGQSVTPAYEGWYPNSDGSYSIVFGYYSRNSEDTLEIPIGDKNVVEGVPDGGKVIAQPSEFLPGRHFGVFAIHVPSDFDGEVTWTLEDDGQTFAIPGGLNPLWKTDAVNGDAMGNHPPQVRFAANGPTGAGPMGIMDDRTLTAQVGQPLEITVWGSDDGVGEQMPGERSKEPLPFHWLKQSGPGEVTFSPVDVKIPVEGGSATTSAVFGAPGSYVLRVRANDASGVVGGGQAQCCWTNGYVKVNVTGGSRRSQ